MTIHPFEEQLKGALECGCMGMDPDRVRALEQFAAHEAHRRRIRLFALWFAGSGLLAASLLGVALFSVWSPKVEPHPITDAISLLCQLDGDSDASFSDDVGDVDLLLAWQASPCADVPDEADPLL